MNQAMSASQNAIWPLAMAHLLALVADVVLIGATIGLAALANPPFGHNANAAIATMGAALAIVSIVAAWVPLGTLRFSRRSVVAPLICVSLMAATVLLMALQGVNAPALTGTFVAGVAQFVILQVPYWLFRAWHKLRIVHHRELTTDWPAERLQYSLWQMLLVMTLVGVTLGICRAILGLFPTSSMPDGSLLTIAVFFVVLVGFNLLVAWPMLWAALSPAGLVRRLAAAAVLVALVIGAAYPLCVAVLGRSEGRWIYWLTFVPQPAFLLTHLFATRLCGYRLVRSS